MRTWSLSFRASERDMTTKAAVEHQQHTSISTDQHQYKHTSTSTTTHGRDSRVGAAIADAAAPTPELLLLAVA